MARGQVCGWERDQERGGQITRIERKQAMKKRKRMYEKLKEREEEGGGARLNCTRTPEKKLIFSESGNKFIATKQNKYDCTFLNVFDCKQMKLFI